MEELCLFVSLLLLLKEKRGTQAAQLLRFGNKWSAWTIKRINEWYMGWSGYYLVTQYPVQFVKIEAHIKRRLRARIVDQQKRRRHLYNKLIKRGISENQARTVFLNHGRWALSRTGALHKAYPNRWFTDVMGLQIRSNAKLKHWLGVRKWIRVA